jgi:hypothetical protein
LFQAVTLVACVWKISWLVVNLTNIFNRFSQFLPANYGIICEFSGSHRGISYSSVNICATIRLCIAPETDSVVK